MENTPSSDWVMYSMRSVPAKLREEITGRAFHVPDKGGPPPQENHRLGRRRKLTDDLLPVSN
ncbi:MAG: hypothetical protein ACREXS_17955 [Gammaproteobacteria bacterium]